MAQGDLRWEIINRAVAGQEPPSITLSSQGALTGARLRVKRSDGVALDLRFGRIPAGGSGRVVLKTPLGRWTYTGELVIIDAAGASTTQPVSFDIIVAEPLQIEAPYARMHLKEGRMEVQLSREAEGCEVTTLVEDRPPIETNVVFKRAPAGTWLPVTWRPHSAADVVLKITLRCQDVDGFSNGLELSPWQIEIPHQDVRFATGRWEVEPSEYGKMDQALTQIATTLRRYSSVLALRLFISGHTDTVGEAAFNRRLSEKRARSIAGIFRQRGVQIPIAYYGAGEAEQRVVTPDETPEPRNRRTRYLLAAHPPGERRWITLE